MQQEIIKLTDDCLAYFQSNCYTQHRIDRYKYMWKHGILSWMREKNLTAYSADTGEEFIHSFIKPYRSPKGCNTKRTGAYRFYESGVCQEKDIYSGSTSS